MSNRRIEERFEFPNGIKGEWEPSRVQAESNRVSEVKEQIRLLNKKAKSEGSSMRYRSVEEES